MDAFTAEEREEVRHLFAGWVTEDVAKILYQKSYAHGFRAELRDIMHEVFRPEVVEEWAR